MGALPINKFVTQLSQAKPHKLVVLSIGNPTSQLANTRHNAGHIVMDHLIEALGGLSTDPNEITSSDTIHMAPLAQFPHIYMAKSRTYMNTSGKAMLAAMKRARQGPHSVFVIHDDIDTQKGVVKFKLESRTMGAHGGLSNICKVYPDPFARMRIGIGAPPDRSPGKVASYVLKKFTDVEKKQLETESIPQAIDMMQRIATAMVPKKKRRKSIQNQSAYPPVDPVQ